jgi:hypothetical protein
MTTQLDATTVSTSIDVQAPIEHAFRVFTEGIGSWWDPGHHILQAELAEMVFEPYVGGHIIDRGTDGSECRWSRGTRSRAGGASQPSRQPQQHRANARPSTAPRG